MCVVTLGTRLMKDISKVYCELNMTLSEFFVKDQDLLLTERRLW